MEAGQREMVDGLTRLLAGHGMTRARLAASLDPPVSHTTVGRWLRGATPYPRHAVQIRRLLDGLPVSGGTASVVPSSPVATSALDRAGRKAARDDERITPAANGRHRSTSPMRGHDSGDPGTRRPGDKVRVAIIGVGNCASALVQGVTYYQDADEDAFVPGLMNVNLGGYHVRDIEFSAAFDIDVTKVGTDLSEAIFAGPNNTYRFAEVPHLGIPVHRGMTHDGLGKYQSQVVTKAPGSTADIVQILRETRTDVVISYLPVGSEMATKWYVEQILEAGCAFVNCIPVFIAREEYWQKRFEEKGLPVIGDDIKSQVGATITHRMLTRLFADRGVRVDRTYQLNFGGNTDFMNMLERERLDSKKVSKTNAVTSQMDYDLPAADVHVGPSDYVPWLEDRKWCHIRMEGTTFGDVPLNLELKLEVWDSPNSAGVVIDAVRCCKIALDHGIGGALLAPSAYFMKSPPEQYHDDLARDRVQEFICIYGAPKASPASVAENPVN
ncbi:MAG: inositol-3-phosphate synthase [Thermomicrobiales bacterium]